MPETQETNGKTEKAQDKTKDLERRIGELERENRELIQENEATNVQVRAFIERDWLRGEVARLNREVAGLKVENE